MAPQRHRTQLLLGNTLVLAISQFAGIVVSLLVTPLILDDIGIEQYGIWILVGSVIAILGLLQIGVARGTIRFIALHAARQELDVVRSIVSYSVAWHLAAAVLLAPVGWLVAEYLLPHLNVSADLVSTAQGVFLLAFAYFFFGAAMRPIVALPIGLERMWITSVATIASQAVYAVAVIGLLVAGAGLYALPIALFIQAAFLSAACYVAGRRLIGAVFGNPFALDRTVRRDLLKFGGWYQVNNISAVVNTETDAVVIAASVDVSTVGYYGIGSRLAALVRLLPLTLLPPLLPAATGMHAEGNEKKIADTVLQGGRLIGLLTIGLAGFVIATSPLIMTFWLGQTYPDVAGITALLVVAYAVNNLTGVGTTVVSAIGKPRYESEYAVLGVILNIAATVLLAPFFGLWGVLAGTVIGVTISSLYFLWRFHTLMALSMWDYVGDWLWKLTAVTLLAAGAVYSVYSALPETFSAGRGPAAFALATLGVLYMGVMLLGLRWFNFLQERDLAILKRALPARLQPLASLPTVEFFFGVRS